MYFVVSKLSLYMLLNHKSTFTSFVYVEYNKNVGNIFKSYNTWQAIAVFELLFQYKFWYCDCFGPEYLIIAVKRMQSYYINRNPTVDAPFVFINGIVSLVIPKCPILTIIYAKKIEERTIFSFQIHVLTY